MKRREFIQTTTFAAIGALALPTFAAAAKAKKGLGLQLYTLRDTIGKDPKGVLKKVASFGYNELETFGYSDGKIFGLAYDEFCAYVKSLGMRTVSGHYGLNQIEGDTWKKAVDDAKKNGMEFMVMPYIVEGDRKTLDDYKKICDKLNVAARFVTQQAFAFNITTTRLNLNRWKDRFPTT